MPCPQLKTMYRSFDNFALHEPRDATMGVLVVRVHKLVNMARRSTPVTLYCKWVKDVRRAVRRGG